MRAAGNTRHMPLSGGTSMPAGVPLLPVHRGDPCPRRDYPGRQHRLWNFLHPGPTISGRAFGRADGAVCDAIDSPPEQCNATMDSTVVGLFHIPSLCIDFCCCSLAAYGAELWLPRAWRHHHHTRWTFCRDTRGWNLPSRPCDLETYAGASPAHTTLYYLPNMTAVLHPPGHLMTTFHDTVHLFPYIAISLIRQPLEEPSITCSGHFFPPSCRAVDL